MDTPIPSIAPEKQPGTPSQQCAGPLQHPKQAFKSVAHSSKTNRYKSQLQRLHAVWQRLHKIRRDGKWSQENSSRNRLGVEMFHGAQLDSAYATYELVRTVAMSYNDTEPLAIPDGAKRPARVQQLTE